MGLDLSKLPAPTTQSAGGVNVAAVLSGLNQAKEFEQGQYFTEPGTYNCEIKRCLLKRSQASGAPVFIVELQVKDILISPPEEQIIVNGQVQMVTPKGAPKVGESRSWVQKLSDTNIAFPALKSFYLAAVAPKTPEERVKAEAATEAVLDQATSEANILAGCVVKVTVIKKTTKKGQVIFLPTFKAVD